MSKTQIVGLVVIATLVAIFLAAGLDSGTYADFTEAFSNPEGKYHVVGQLNRNKDVVYDPEVNPNLVTFYMTDEKGVERKVVLNKPKPQDFERSEKVVLVGEAKGEEFHAGEILLKCPSKYNEQNAVSH